MERHNTASRVTKGLPRLLIIACIAVAALITGSIRQFVTGKHRPSPAYVVIPVKLVCGHLIAQARINGNHTECIVDTGCPMVTWPDGCNFVSRRPRAATVPMTSGGYVVNGVLGTIDDLAVGDYTVHKISSVRLLTQDKSARDVDARTMPILGNDAFLGCALTVDLSQRRLVVYPSLRNISLVPHGPRSFVLPIMLLPVGPPGCCLPAIPLRVSGHSVWMFLDTGLPVGLIIVPSAMKALGLKPNARVITSCAFGQIVKPCVPRVTYSIPRPDPQQPVISGQDFATVDSISRSNAVSGAIGLALLRKCTVTIDYPARCVLIDPQ